MFLHPFKCNYLYTQTNTKITNNDRGGVDADDCDGYRCNSGVCIPQEQRCDQRPDCEGGEDEDDCVEGSLKIF